MKDHKGPVNCIRIKASDEECVSASSDGSCIIWDLHTFKRRTSLFANTFFKSVVYHPDESQLVTAGTDRKVRRCCTSPYAQWLLPACCAVKRAQPRQQDRHQCAGCAMHRIFCRFLGRTGCAFAGYRWRFYSYRLHVTCPPPS